MPSSPTARLLAACACTLLAACAPAAPRPALPDGAAPVVSFDAAFFRDPPRPGRVFRLDPAASRIELLVFRSGPLARRGHNHVIAAGAFEGAVFVPDARLADARVELVLEPAGFIVDDPVRRSARDEGFDGALPARAREGTRQNMLGPDVLDSARHPLIGVRSVAVDGELPHLAVELALTLAGVTRTLLVPVEVRIDGARLQARGTLALRPSDHGIAPFSAAGGLLRVADAVIVEFELHGAMR